MRFVLIVSSTLLLAPFIAVAAGEFERPAPTSRQAGPPSGQPRHYVHRLTGYSINVPPDAQLAEKGEKADIAIRSRKGYVVSLQTGDVKPNTSLKTMAENLERRYLGLGRTWQKKVSENQANVSGLDAIDLLYEGDNTRTQVIIARGQKTDFVFMFTAPLRQFKQLVGAFEWILAGFEPSPEDVVRQTAKQPSPSSLVEASTFKRFSEAGYGYAIGYPVDWIMDKPAPFQAVFSGKPGTEAYFATVGIRNFKLSSLMGARQAVATVMANLKGQIGQAAQDIGYFGEGPLFYENGPFKIEGYQFLAVYKRNGQRFKKWTIMLPRPDDGTLVHIWTYAAPETQFDAFLSTAETMRKTWEITLRTSTR
jgi:hypothetical protein